MKKPIALKLITKAILVIAFLSSCKKTSEKEDTFSNNKELTIDRIFEAPPKITFSKIAASMDGKYICTWENLSVLFSSINISKDEGQSWEQAGISSRPGDEFRITKSGYTYLGQSTNGNTPSLFNLNTKKEIAINFQGSLGSGEDFYLGHDDYVYARNQFKKIGENNWQTMPTTATGIYCGQDVNNGGIAFYDTSTKKLNIHNPTNNTIATYNITIDLEQIKQGAVIYGVSPKTLYNGSGKFAIAYTKGVAIQDLTTGTVTYTNWGAAYAGFASNPLSFSIDKEGSIFTTLGGTNAPTVSLKLTDNKYTSFFRNSDFISRGDYTYYMGGAYLIKESKNGKQKMQALSDMYTKGQSVTRIDVKSARVVGGKTYALLRLEDAASGALYTYSAERKDFDIIGRTAGKYDYIYAEGTNIYLYGVDSILHSANNGASWNAYLNSAGARKSISYVAKSGSTYYGLHVYNYRTALGATGHEVDKHNYATYSSSDAINWKPIASKTDQSGLGPEALTAEGLMTYRYNMNAPGYAASMKGEVSYDYGTTWNATTALGFNTARNNELFMVAYDGTGVIIMRFDKNFKELSSQRAKPSGQFSVAGLRNIHFDSEDKINFINNLGFFKVR